MCIADPVNLSGAARRLSCEIAFLPARQSLDCELCTQTSMFERFEDSCSAASLNSQTDAYSQHLDDFNSWSFI